MKSASRSIGAVAAFALALSLCGETVTVDSVTSLTNELDRLNRDRNSSHKIILKALPGGYDVSGCAMLCDDASTTPFQESRSHLAVSFLTLEGETSDARDVVVFGNRSNRIFYCYAGTLKNLTISNGCVTANSTGGAHGGGLLSRNESTVLKNVVVTSCAAPDGNGGGVNVAARVEDCIVENNTANFGAGICSVRSGSAAKPGVGVLRTTVRNNVATKQGGGIAMSVVKDSVICFNTSGSLGGGYFHNSVGWCEGCTIISNTAAIGGGGVVLYGTGGSYITNCLVACNWTKSAGGGVLFSGGHDVWDCVVSNNVCSGDYTDDTWYGGGGGITGAGRVLGGTVIGNSVTNWSATSGSSGHGGGLYDCSFVTNVLIVGNSALSRGGGAHSCKLVDCIVSNNLCECFGGGVANCSVTESDIVFNRCRYEHGINNSDYRNRSFGAGAYSSHVTNSIVCGNAGVPTAAVAEAYGGAGYDTVFHGCVVSNNYAGLGPALYGGFAERCVFANNASKSGGYIVCDTSHLVDCDVRGGVFDNPGALVNCRVRDYDASVYATIPEGANVFTSGVFSATSAMQLLGTVRHKNYGFSATNTLFANNQVNSLFYPGFGGTVPFVNCSFVSNRVNFTCTSFGMAGHLCELVNTLFVGNRSYDGTASREWWPDWGGDTNVVARSCLFGTGARRYLPRVMDNCKLDKDVPFATTDGAWPYQPFNRSVIHGGLVQDWMTGANDVRGEGYPRLRDGKVDIGCYQCWLPRAGVTVILR